MTMSTEDLDQLRSLTSSMQHGPSGFFSIDNPSTDVLFVDDEIESCKVFKRLIEQRLGLTVHTALSPAHALSVLHTHADKICMMVTDIRMPVNDGVWLVEQVRKTWPHITCVYSTAYSAHVTNKDAMALADGIIEKPWDTKHLLRLVNMTVLKSA